jgi:hypothetical protein
MKQMPAPVDGPQKCINKQDARAIGMIASKPVTAAVKSSYSPRQATKAGIKS